MLHPPLSLRGHPDMVASHFTPAFTDNEHGLAKDIKRIESIFCEGFEESATSSLTY